MAGTIFRGTYHNGVILDKVKTRNPATVAASGYVSGTFFGVLGSTGIAWGLTNFGRIKAKGTGTGVILESGGSVANGSTASTAARISAADGTAVAIEHGTGKLVNFGTIESSSTSRVAVYMAGGNLQNGAPASTAALIRSPSNAIAMRTGSGSIANFGTIEGTGALSAVYLGAGGTVRNFGTIKDAASSGISLHNQAGTVDNFGKILSTATGTVGLGVYMQDGGLLYNGATGTVTASHNDAVLAASAAATIVNLGTIRGAAATEGCAVKLDHGGVVINGKSRSPGGLISGRGSGIILANAIGTVANYGTIESTTTVLVGGSLHAVGVLLGDGGALLNGAADATKARITAAEVGVYIGGINGAPTPGAAPATVANYGTIESTGHGAIGSKALLIASGGSVRNRGLIESAVNTGISFHGKAGTVDNFGTVESLAGGTLGNGVYLQQGGTVTNRTSGRITADRNDGISIRGAAGTVVNYGTIHSVGGRGVYFGAGGTVTNHGTIETQSAAHPGVSFHQKAGTVINSGTIESDGNHGVYLQTGGSVTNQKGGLLQGGSNGNGIEIVGGRATVTNAGRIVGQNGILVSPTDTSFITVTNAGAIIGAKAAVQLGAGNDLLIDDPAGSFGGIVDGGKGSNTLELAAGSNRGSLDGLGTRIVNFGTITFDPGSAWTLDIDKAADFGETITGFALGDTIDLAGIAATGLSYTKGALTVMKGAAAVARFTMPGVFTTADFGQAPDGDGGTKIRRIQPLAKIAGPDFDAHHRSVWGTGSAQGFDFTLPEKLTTISKTVARSTTFLGIPVDASAHFKAGITGGFAASGGSFALNYPVDINGRYPTDVPNGGAVTIDTSNYTVDMASLDLAGPGLTANLETFVDAGGSLVLGKIADFRGSLLNFNRKLGDLTLHLPKDIGKITLASPPPFHIEGASVTAAKSLPSVTAIGTGSPFLSGELDLTNLAALLLGVPPINGSFKKGGVALDYTLVDIGLDAGLSLGQKVTFTPTGIDVNMSWNGRVEDKPLGSVFTFTAPRSGSGKMKISATYTLDGTLETQTGIVGNLAIDVSALGLSGSVGPLSGSVGPLFKREIPPDGWSTGLRSFNSMTSEPFSERLGDSTTYTIAFGSGATHVG